MQADSISADFVVVGAGVAGLRAAIELARGGKVLVLTKGDPGDSATAFAQGGIAAALSDEDEISLHEQDTLRAGAGLCNPAAVKALVEEGPRYIQELIAWGAEFDRTGTRLTFVREGAHSRSRVLHAHGDSTGREISRALLAKLHSLDAITLLPHVLATELIHAPNESRSVAGLRFLDESSERIGEVECRAVLLATGGLGHAYLETTNPSLATGDGMAIGYRAGAGLADMEFIQFHPTALAVKGAPSFLLSEALRGEGAVLRNVLLERFMPRYHEAAELAPRDVVSRAIVSEMKKTRADFVYLDMTSRNEEFIRKRFPRIHSTCMKYGLDIAADLAPVRPATHYAIGGLKTDLFGRTTLRGLYAAGEAASTGVHGANRLASNSLLEGLVFGARTGRAMLEDAPSKAGLAARSSAANAARHSTKSASNVGRGAATASHGPHAAGPVESRSAPASAETPNAALDTIRAILWQQVGILREGRDLSRALAQLSSMEIAPPRKPSRRAWELYNIWTLAQVIARCALAREESRGSHYRIDFPCPDDDRFAKHSVVSCTGQIHFE